jgi:hypothetical protein
LLLIYIVNDNKSNVVYDAGVLVLCRLIAVTLNPRLKWFCKSEMNRKGCVVRLEGR